MGPNLRTKAVSDPWSCSSSSLISSGHYPASHDAYAWLAAPMTPSARTGRNAGGQVFFLAARRSSRAPSGPTCTS
eukprot:7318365-Pyramimonas_sp.AAC.1